LFDRLVPVDTMATLTSCLLALLQFSFTILLQCSSFDAIARARDLFNGRCARFRTCALKAMHKPSQALPVERTVNNRKSVLLKTKPANCIAIRQGLI